MKRLNRIALIGTLTAGLLSACGGGGGGDASMTNASASNARYSQDMIITFSGQGLDESVVAKVDGPCTNLTRSTVSSSTTLQYRCTVEGVGRITPYLVTVADGVVLGSLKVDIPLPRVSVAVTQGEQSGTFVLELDPLAAPQTVKQFLAYVAAGFYTSTIFHRVNPQLAILGGGFSSSTEGIVSAKLTTRDPIALEQTGLKNLRGSIAMYRETAPNSGNSMFFINTVDNPQFDAGSVQTPEGFAVFGKVVDRLDIIDMIAAVPVRPDLSLGVADVPQTAVTVTSMVQTR
jgi:peptidyl-prolyl cis-trans isomerase A (cyclophilin A)